MLCSYSWINPPPPIYTPKKEICRFKHLYQFQQNMKRIGRCPIVCATLSLSCLFRFSHPFSPASGTAIRQQWHLNLVCARDYWAPALVSSAVVPRENGSFPLRNMSTMNTQMGKQNRFLLCSLSSIQRKPYLQKNECKKIIWLYHFRCEEPMENDNGWIPENRLTEHHCSTHLFCTESLISGLLLKLYLQYFYTHTPFLPSHHS